MLVTDFSRQITLLIILGFWPLTASAANAQQLCHVDAPRYRLQDDTVSWSMTIVTGHSCIHGTRLGNIQFASLKLTSPPRFGEVALQGSGFMYSPNIGFHGQDEFSLTVVGAFRGTRGSSTIEVNVSVAPNISADSTPPSVSFIAPSEGATLSGSYVALSAAASDDVGVANVQFIVTGKNVGSAVFSGLINAVLSPPYEAVWDITTVPDGSYTLYAVAQDRSGNLTTSSVQVTVKNK
jgi:hypothetical protein